MKWGWLCLLGVFVPLASMASAPTVERYAFIAASNDGGVGRVKLRYAESDALSLANVFEEIGGLENKNKTILLSPTRAQFVESLQKFGEKVGRRATTVKNAQLLFYYSGHSDDQGLLLSDGLVTYKDLRTALDAIPVEVRVAILDSCQSGAFTRLKGGKRQPAFLVDDSKNIKGTVLLAASSENEAAQESDKIGASFFTHYLVSALRGAGDISGDKVVTLNEAYYYAFNETLARTEGSKQGAQHPAYDIQIAGAGDLVLTDVKQTSATLVVPSNIVGRLYVRDPSGRLVVELNKLVNNEIELALMPGEHQVLLDQEGGLYKQEVMVARDSRVVLASGDFVTVVAQRNRARGGESVGSRVSVFDWRLQNANRLTMGFANSPFHFQRDDWIYDFPEDIATDYRGYALTYWRDIGPDASVQVAFSEAKATGVVRSLYVAGLTSILGDDMHHRNGKRLYAGLGVMAFRLFEFPEELAQIYTISGSSSSYNYALHVPLGFQLEYGRFVVDAAAIFRYGSVPLKDEWKPAYVAQMGFRF